MRKTKNKFYEAPQAECVEIQIEQCIATSDVNAGGGLGNLDPNDLLNDFGSSNPVIALDDPFMGF
ncbi:MAG: hypothetical protein J6X99_07005 [Bacteroidales bacterium]|nr:hypothetical protein [Bacteroidales bacterium]